MFSNKLLTLYIILLLLAIFAMGMLLYYKPASVPTRDYPEIQAEGILRIVTEYNQSDYYLSGDDELEGFQYELCRMIAEYSGLEVYIYLMSLDESFAGLSTNQCDIIAQNIPTTSRLKEEYLFTDPVVLNKQVLVQRIRHDSSGVEPVRNQLNLAQKTLYVPKNSPALLRLRNLQHEIGDSIFIIEEPLYSSEQLIIMVARGDIDYAVCDQQIARTAQKQFPDVDILTDISFTQLQSWAVRKSSPALSDSINHWFRLIRENGAYDKIYRKYYK
jgi:membrane-bound lytic murein transglycosylase MltF